MVYLALVILGLACGSFVNALVWRIHEQESSNTKRKDPKLSISKGRSMCPACKHELAAKDLIPLFSWISLGGKCRYCKKPISAQYPIVEAVTALLFVHSYNELIGSNIVDLSLNPYEIIYFLFLAFILTGMVALFVYDLKWMILPNRIVYPLIAITSLFRVYESLFPYGDLYFDYKILVSSLAGAVLLGGMFYLLFQISKGRWIGGGDVRLGVFIGILLGPMLAYLALLIASFLGSLIILSLLAFKVVKRNQQVPFGPFLLTGTYFAMLYGQQIIDWYSDQFLAGLI